MIYGDYLVVWAEEVYLGEAGVALPEAAAVVRVRHVAALSSAICSVNEHFWPNRILTRSTNCIVPPQKSR